LRRKDKNVWPTRCFKRTEFRIRRSLQQFLLAQGSPQNTRVTYLNFVRHLGDFLGPKSFIQVQRFDLTEFQGFLYRQRYGSASRAPAVHATRKFYEFLEKGEVVKMSPARFIHTPKQPRKLPGSLSEEQVERLIGAAATPRDLALLEFAVSRVARTGSCFSGDLRPMLLMYLQGRKVGALFQTEHRIQKGGVSKDEWGTWRGYWRERDEEGEVKDGECATRGL
jgi:site-specific recombinase XerC